MNKIEPGVGLSRSWRVCLGAAIGAALLSSLSGCSVSGGNISRSAAIAVQRVPSAKVDILWANVRPAQDGLIVRGVVRRREYSGYPLLVHVDAAVLSDSGEVIQETTGQDVKVPRRLAGKGLNYNDFEIRLPATPPEGGSVKLTCHAGSRDVHVAGFHLESGAH